MKKLSHAFDKKMMLSVDSSSIVIRENQSSIVARISIMGL